MKREFLQNFKLGDQTLTKEIIDAIMAENGRDIEEAKKPFSDYDSIKAQLQTAKDGLKAFEGVDIFQSTHPARGATSAPHSQQSTRNYFNPRTPRGVRQ